MSDDGTAPCAYRGCAGGARWHAEAREGARRAEVRVCALHLAYLHRSGRLGDYGEAHPPPTRGEGEGAKA